MRPATILAAAFGVVLCGTLANAATQAEAAAALAATQSAEAEAGHLRNQWLPTEAELKTAQAAMTAGDFDAALAAAQRAEALARQSVEQTHEQDKLWSDAVIK
jgi:hypothetical protein